MHPLGTTVRHLGPENFARLLATRVPRYTSYPVATRFHGGVDKDLFRGWLSNLPDAAQLSLYLHVPFCISLCWFCGCHTSVVNHYGPVENYLDLLEHEIDLVSRCISGTHPVAQVHLGGGTPTILEPNDLYRLGEHLKRRFESTADTEFAVEIDPRSLTREKIAVLANLGVNRASLGVQDCHPEVQKSVNRWQPFDLTKRTAHELREAGITSLNIDLMYGLPHQTVAHLEKTIAQVLTLDPDRLAVFGYAHLPEQIRHQALIPKSSLPDVDERLRQFEAAYRMLISHGYSAIGLDHFAKPTDPLAIALADGGLKRNFQGYTSDGGQALIGLGASAISSLPDGYAQNAANVPAYRKAILENDFATVRGFVLDDDHRLRAAVIERLMCDLSVNLERVAAAFDRPAGIFSPEIAALKPFTDNGIVAVTGNVVSVVPEARAALRLVCSVFDSYMQAENIRHSVAI